MKSQRMERPKAVVLDDEYAIRTLICDILKERGYEVHVSSEPFFSPIFLESKCSCPVEIPCANVIITDINMPDMTGLEFIEHQKINGCKVQNIAVMSGRWTEEELQHAKSLGCRTFKKPFRIDELKTWLDSCEKTLDSDNRLSGLPGYVINK